MELRSAGSPALCQHAALRTRARALSLFVDAVRAHLLEYDALFWWTSIFGTVAEKAAAAPRMTRATRLEAKIEAEIEAWLGAPDARPQPMRLDMDGAEAASSPPAATAVPSPSALKMPPTAAKMCSPGGHCVAGLKPDT